MAWQYNMTHDEWSVAKDKAMNPLPPAPPVNELPGYGMPMFGGTICDVCQIAAHTSWDERLHLAVCQKCGHLPESKR